MKAILIADEKWGVSNKGKSLISIPAERKTMLDTVKGHVVVYDYKYVDELPGQQALTGSDNIVFTDNAEVNVKNALVCKTLEEVERAIESFSDREVYIIHGAKLYNHFFDRINTFHVTKVEYSYHTDESIKNLDEEEDLTITHDSDELYLHDMVYSFLQYERI